jgi:hypothetical protein
MKGKPATPPAKGKAVKSGKPAPAMPFKKGGKVGKRGC